jgi:hypothetical protein
VVPVTDLAKARPGVAHLPGPVAAARVARLRVAPVKGLGLLERDAVDIGVEGVADDRRFFLLGPDGRHRSGLAHGPLVRIVPDYDPVTERLTLTFPDGQTVSGDAGATGEAVDVPWDARTLRARLVTGFDEALSDYVGMPLRLARAEPGSRPSSAHVTILSAPSVDAVERAAGLPERVDDRRFRMLVTIDGCPPFAEDAWVGQQVALGTAVVRVEVPAARCATTTRDPATGLRDLDMLRILKDVRGVSERRTVDLGVYCEVVRPGRVTVGDTVEPLGVASAA